MLLRYRTALQPKKYKNIYKMCLINLGTSSKGSLPYYKQLQALYKKIYSYSSPRTFLKPPSPPNPNFFWLEFKIDLGVSF